jgi:hypothetical protein
MKKTIFTSFFLLTLATALAAVPEMVFKTPDNKTMYIRDYVGEPRLLRPDAPRYGVVLVFFTLEDPTLNQWFNDINDILKESKTAKRRFFFISVDENTERIKSFKDSRKLSAPLYMDVFRVSENLSEIRPGLLNNGPVIFIYQPSGTLVEKFVPFQPYMADELRSALRQLP